MEKKTNTIAYALKVAAEDVVVSDLLLKNLLNQIPEKNVRTASVSVRSPYFMFALSQVITVGLLVFAFISYTQGTSNKADSVDLAFQELDTTILQFEMAMDSNDAEFAYLELR